MQAVVTYCRLPLATYCFVTSTNLAPDGVTVIVQLSTEDNCVLVEAKFLLPTIEPELPAFEKTASENLLNHLLDAYMIDYDTSNQAYVIKPYPDHCKPSPEASIVSSTHSDTISAYISEPTTPSEPGFGDPMSQVLSDDDVAPSINLSYDAQFNWADEAEELEEAYTRKKLQQSISTPAQMLVRPEKECPDDSEVGMLHSSVNFDPDANDFSNQQGTCSEVLEQRSRFLATHTNLDHAETLINRLDLAVHDIHGRDLHSFMERWLGAELEYGLEDFSITGDTLAPNHAEECQDFGAELHEDEIDGSPFEAEDVDEVHHYNQFDRPVSEKSSTPPEVSAWFAFQTSRGRIGPCSGFSNRILMIQASRYLDPIQCRIDDSAIARLDGSILRDALHGYCNKAYEPWGRWLNERSLENEQETILANACDYVWKSSSDAWPACPICLDEIPGDIVVNDDGRPHTTRIYTKPLLGRSSLHQMSLADDTEEEIDSTSCVALNTNGFSAGLKEQHNYTSTCQGIDEVQILLDDAQEVELAVSIPVALEGLVLLQEAEDAKPMSEQPTIEEVCALFDDGRFARPVVRLLPVDNQSIHDHGLGAIPGSAPLGLVEVGSNIDDASKVRQGVNRNLKTTRLSNEDDPIPSHEPEEESTSMIFPFQSLSDVVEDVVEVQTELHPDEENGEVDNSHSGITGDSTGITDATTMADIESSDVDLSPNVYGDVARESPAADTEAEKTPEVDDKEAVGPGPRAASPPTLLNHSPSIFETPEDTTPTINGDDSIKETGTIEAVPTSLYEWEDACQTGGPFRGINSMDDAISSGTVIHHPWKQKTGFKKKITRVLKKTSKALGRSLVNAFELLGKQPLCSGATGRSR